MNSALEQKAGNVGFFVVLLLVFAITVGSLGVALYKTSERTIYVNAESDRMQALIPKGDGAAAQKDAYADVKNALVREENNQQNFITILMGVFQAGTGAILGLLTGRATSK
jgi:hypothetical protein